MIILKNRNRNGRSVFTNLQRICFFCLLFLTPLWAGRVIVRTLEGDFEQEFRILEQGGVWRIDAPAKYWSILYDSKSGRYTGLEHRDAGYWEFRWEEVQRATQGTKHHLNRLSDLNIEGYSSYDLTRPSKEPQKGTPWKISPIQKEGFWFDLPSRFWDLNQSEKGNLRAQTVIHPFLKEFFSQFSQIHEQIRQAVVRPLWPEKVDEVLSTLRASGEVGVKLEWGSEGTPFYWKVERFDEKSSEASTFFQVPSKYHPTTIESLRGILNSLEVK